MNILYIHGLESKLSPDKKAILAEFGKVLAPNLDYYKDPNAIETILNAYKDEEIDVVIGSSMGGFAAYYASTALEAPALLFNPALKERSVEQKIPDISIGSLAIKYFILGARDEVVDPAGTLKFIGDNYNEYTDFQIRIHPELGHRVRMDIFQEEVNAFFDRI